MESLSPLFYEAFVVSRERDQRDFLNSRLLGEGSNSSRRTVGAVDQDGGSIAITARQLGKGRA